MSSSSSSTIPPTHYILDGIRELLIQHMDSSNIYPALPKLGMMEKEKFLKVITHDTISKTIPEYLTREQEIADGPKEDFTRMLLNQTLRNSPGLQ